ncbi:M28 family peptidase [Gulosibacter chungangensis]|uniref:M28 family peptidase n=1 Tax=Gulosibacter chungangensis TaxID=979746 RepID=A0A7J5BCZ9_9MICO|nr:M28 family peptidase [Gulosibacter chungangensis]KAB1643922.1 M28 family peptidase [Gulosibacter chungangensis]
MSAAAAVVPLVISTGIANAAPAPEGGIEAIESGTYIPGYLDEYLSQPVAADVFGHVEHLSVDIGPRVAGTEAEDAGIAYVQSLLDSYGYETEIETFATPVSDFADVTPSRDDVEGTGSWQFRPAANALFTGPDAPVSGEVIDIDDGSDLAAADIAGKFVLVNWMQNATNRNALLSDIAAQNPAGIIQTQTTPNGAIPNPGSVPESVQGTIVTSVGTIQGERIRALLETEALSLSIVTDQSTTESSNVIGVLPAVGDSEGTAPIVYIGSHIDSVVGSPGASDNASGVAIMLESARILALYDWDVEIRIGAWGAEERGIIGSAYHANQLTQDEIDRTIGAWNMDMAGTSYLGTEEQPTGFWGLSVNPDNADNDVLNFASEVTQHQGEGELNRGYVGRSDHQSFHDVGINAAVFSWMFWSEDTSIVLEPTYHRPSDTIDNISEERLGIAAQYIGGSVFLASLNEVTVSVLAEDGSAAAGVPVAMQCGEDDGWREVGETDESGSIATLAPHVECDFAALAEDGTRGGSLDEQISGDTAVSIALEAAVIPPTDTEEPTDTPAPTETSGPTETVTPTEPGDTTAPTQTGGTGGDSTDAGNKVDNGLAQTGASITGGVLLAAALVAAGAYLVTKRNRITATDE